MFVVFIRINLGITTGHVEAPMSSVALRSPILEKPAVGDILAEGTQAVSGVPFAPGGIHSAQARSTWESIGATNWVLQTLKEGYSIPFSTTPGEYGEKNNASAVKEM